MKEYSEPEIIHHGELNACFGFWVILCWNATPEDRLVDAVINLIRAGGK
jgi:hypothetical protein